MSDGDMSIAIGAYKDKKGQHYIVEDKITIGLCFKILDEMQVEFIGVDQIGPDPSWILDNDYLTDLDDDKAEVLVVNIQKELGKAVAATTKCGIRAVKDPLHWGVSATDIPDEM